VKLRIATCATLPEPDLDEEPLANALAAAGIDAALVGWDDPRVDWDAPIPTVLRSTWNYPLAVDDFLAWLARVSAVAQLWNPVEVVRENVFKRYLVALAARGIPTVATTVVPRGDARDVHLDIDAHRIVIKPEVGAGSIGTRVFRRGDPEAHAHLATITARGAALVQPYFESVENEGERSMIWIDGEFTHAIRKTPRFSGDVERVDGPVPIADDERAVAQAALDPYIGRVLYARVDLARDGAGTPTVMELELVEPSLFFAQYPPALERFIDALVRELRRQPR
jgi:hypothetical protein